ncbi:hypothetical protein CHU98_g3823 [Xylaria longipes]|nr:hypothetical protein CHU98_g3823 [Xylaria longipes]
MEENDVRTITELLYTRVHCQRDNDISTVIYYALVHSEFEGLAATNKFCPEDKLDKYLTMSAISREFKKDK